MSDYQVTNYGICGECKWHTYEEIDRGYVCTNADSPYCTEWTDYTDGCEEWKQWSVILTERTASKHDILDTITVLESEK